MYRNGGFAFSKRQTPMNRLLYWNEKTAFVSPILISFFQRGRGPSKKIRNKRFDIYKWSFLPFQNGKTQRITLCSSIQAKSHLQEVRQRIDVEQPQRA